MSIIVACECGRKFRAKEEHAGKRTKCPVCGRMLVIAAQVPTTPREGAIVSPQTGAVRVPTDPPGIGTVVRAEVVAESSSKSPPHKQCSSVCFFCGHNESQETVSYPVHMFKLAPGKSFTSLSTIDYYCTHTELVPRCETCKGIHENVAKWSSMFLLKSLFAGLLLGAVLAIIQIVRLRLPQPLQAVLGGSALGGICGAIVGVVLRPIRRPHVLRGIRPLTDNAPSVQDALTQGWKLGEVPDPPLPRILIGFGVVMILVVHSLQNMSWQAAPGITAPVLNPVLGSLLKIIAGLTLMAGGVIGITHALRRRAR